MGWVARIAGACNWIALNGMGLNAQGWHGIAGMGAVGLCGVVGACVGVPTDERRSIW